MPRFRFTARRMMLAVAIAAAIAAWGIERRMRSGMSRAASGWECFAFLPIIVFLGAVSWLLRSDGDSAGARVEAWAKGAGYLLTRREERFLSRGPFR